jgi:hypothetical protein
MPRWLEIAGVIAFAALMVLGAAALFGVGFLVGYYSRG